MDELDDPEALPKPGAVVDRHHDLANGGKHAGGFDQPFPLEVRELAGERRLEIAAGVAEIRKSLELRLGHHRLRQHRGARGLLRANDGLHALMMQSQQAHQCETKDRHCDHDLEQSKRTRAPAERIHRDIPAGITSPLTIVTRPVSGENSSVITSPDSSSRWTTVAST